MGRSLLHRRCARFARPATFPNSINTRYWISSHSDLLTDDRSIYNGVVKVRCGIDSGNWSKGELSSQPILDCTNTSGTDAVFVQEAVEETQKLLLESVAIRLHADVPVAARVSGGIDSGLVCWAIARLGADVTAYTIGITVTTPGMRRESR